MKPGIYTNITNEEYHGADGWSTSNLKQAEMSVLVAENKQMYQYDSPAFTIGTAVHTGILEPEKFDEQFAVMPKVDRGTKAGKAAAEAFELESAGKTVLSGDDYDQIKAMVTSVTTIYGQILNGCESEISVFANDEHNGILRKCRPDSLCASRKTIFDLKTTRENFHWFGRKALYDLSYDMQAAWYVDTCRMAGMDIEEFAFIVVSTTKPYYTWGIIATDDFLESGREKYMRILRKIRAKREKNVDTLFHPTMIPGWRQSELGMV